MRAGRMIGFLLLICLAGCGQKGALYMPGHAPKSQIPKAPAAQPTPPKPPAPPAVTPPPAQPTSGSLPSPTPQP